MRVLSAPNRTDPSEVHLVPRPGQVLEEELRIELVEEPSWQFLLPLAKASSLPNLLAKHCERQSDLQQHVERWPERRTDLDRPPHCNETQIALEVVEGLQEQLLAEPMSFSLHCRLAELLYTMGGADNLLAARKYFAQSYHLNKRNPRALVGMAMAATALAREVSAPRDGAGAGAGAMAEGGASACSDGGGAGSGAAAAVCFARFASSLRLSSRARLKSRCSLRALSFSISSSSSS